jgi:MFS family permease
MMVDPIRRDLRVSEVDMGALMGFSFAICYAFAGLPIGWAADRYSRRAIIFGAVALWSVASVLCGLASGYQELFLARMGVGIGEAALLPAGYSILTDSFPRKSLVTALGVFASGAMIGGAVSKIISGLAVGFFAHSATISVPLLGEISSWRLIFLVTGLPGVLVALLVFTVPEPPRGGTRPAGDDVSIKGLWRFLKSNSRLAWSMLGSFVVMTIVFNAAGFWTPSYVIRDFKLSPAVFGPILGILEVLAGVLGQLFGARMINRLYNGGRKDAPMWFYRIALAIAGPASVAAFLAPNVWLFFGLYTIGFQFLLVQSTAYALAIIQLVVPNQQRGQFSALFMFAATLIGASVGPSLIAALTQSLFHNPASVGRSIALTIAVCVIVALISISLGMKSLRRAVSEAEAWPNAA